MQYLCGMNKKHKKYFVEILSILAMVVHCIFPVINRELPCNTFIINRVKNSPFCYFSCSFPVIALLSLLLFCCYFSCYFRPFFEQKTANYG